MEPSPKFSSPPPPYDDIAPEVTKNPCLPPVTLLLDGQSIRDESSLAHLYQLSRCVTTLPRTPPKNSSITFERVESHAPEKLEASETAEPHYRHLFYLAHPADAQYRTDIPEYYITSVDTDTVGNIYLEANKPRFQKNEFKLLLSSKRTASDRPLFDEPGKASPLFTARPAKLMSSCYSWIQRGGSQVAVEDGKGAEHKLAIMTAMTQEMRDALVAVWLLRLWYETAESKQVKREELERMMPPIPHQDWKLGKRVGVLGGLAGAGGC
ncbi:hypothetical protein BJX63DRAFT_433397 [Aspergillus granulosus]|uniref:Uncharacterized protein n=1 Tax=Aspergillus granulosus TaxID=176169 RepID=A0ABR4H7E4_9EURO